MRTYHKMAPQPRTTIELRERVPGRLLPREEYEDPEKMEEEELKQEAER